VRLLLACGCVAIASLAICVAYAVSQESRADQWKQVYDAMAKELPRTALEKLEPIIASAKKEGAWPEAVRAVSLKILLESGIDDSDFEGAFPRMRQAIEQSPEPMKPAMHAILAHWYWRYFQEHRWRIGQRTETSDSPGDDLTTWSLPRIVAEIDRQFQAALAQGEALKRTPIAEYKPLLQEGTMPASYRPTVYDLLLYEAIAFYASGEATVTQPEDAFELEAGSPIFAAPDQFLAWELSSDGHLAKAIKLYQQLLRLHADDADRSAYLSADLERLLLGYSYAVGSEKDERYLAALKRFAEAHRDHALASLAYYRWAEVLQRQDKLVEAHKLAAEGKQLHPDSVGAKLCHNLIAQIEQREVTVLAERVWNKPWPAVEVSYRNIDHIYFRVVKADWESRLRQMRFGPEHWDQDAKRQLLAQPAVKAWDVQLPPTSDYRERKQAVAVPEDLEPGFYYLIASCRDDFSQRNNVLLFTEFWVSDLALVMRERHGDPALQGLVTLADSGEPVEGATVKTWRLDPRSNQWIVGPQGRTDAAGLFNIPVERRDYGQFAVLVQWGQHLASRGFENVYGYDQRQQPFESTVFFTDRALYRPGQTIHYKGLSFRADHRNRSYEVLPRRQLTVIFQDPNGKEIARQQHQTNAFGAFHGSFTAPANRLLGRMMIQVQGGPPGMAQVAVEEYKRPKFEVQLHPAQEAPRLGEEVLLTGTASAYTGAPIDGAKVRYRVVREVRFPDWWSWWRGFQPQPQQEIAHGTVQTDREGRFQVTFTAVPDRSVPETSEPVFVYRVTADVTDNAGETRSASRQIRVGYAALQATLTADSWQTTANPVEIKITTTSLDGEGREAGGKVKIYQLQAPDRVHRAPLTNDSYPYYPGYGARGGFENGAGNDPDDLSNPANWPLGEVVAEQNFATRDNGTAELAFTLQEGVYQAVLESQDRFGKTVTARLPLTVIHPEADRLNIKVPQLLKLRSTTVEPGEEFVAVWGSGYDNARAYVEIERQQQIVKAFWTDAKTTQAKIAVAVPEEWRGGFTLRVTMVRENRAYIESHRIDVPWTNKQLKVAWERFTSKLLPGQKETWTAVVTGPDAQRAAAEMVATLYDASLDTYLPHEWMRWLNIFYQDHSTLNVRFDNGQMRLRHLAGGFSSDLEHVVIRYPHLDPEIVGYGNGVGWMQNKGGGLLAADYAAAVPLAAQARGMGGMAPGREMALRKSDGMPPADANVAAEAAPADRVPDTQAVAPRTNLAETAFFFPHLTTDDEGTVRISFTMPEALTQWKFMAFAHDTQLRSGSLHDRVVTSKDLMVEPNPPRFVREGDELEFAVKVTNRSAKAQQGKLRLTFTDARTGSDMTAALGIEDAELPFEVPSGESRSYAWRLSVPNGAGYLVYRVVGTTGMLSDGEENFLPVLSKRILVTESLPLPIRGEQAKTFQFEHLLTSGDSKTLQSQGLTVEMVSNPAWYAVLALPYLMEYPHQCNDQVFNRFYANAVAQHIVKSDPTIRRVFEQWRNTPALDSPLFKNQDIKNVLVEETPWLRDAQNESQARRNIAILFDENRLTAELRSAFEQLAQGQYDDGAWPWFPGGRGNDFITLYITTGFGRLRQLGVPVDVQPAIKSLHRLDAWIDRNYRAILEAAKRDREQLSKSHLNPTIALYLYGRSFFLKDQPVANEHREAFSFFENQAKEHWTKLDSRQSQAHLAIALHRLGQRESALAIMESLRQRAVRNDELGMYWHDGPRSWWWYRAPIETQALMIEAFEEVARDPQVVEECQVWLLKQKQTQDWKTTKATADAVYALLLRGVNNLLASDALVEVTLGDKRIEPGNVEAGTGYYREQFAGSDVKPAMGHITVKKDDPGVAWGAVHWQYLEDIDKVPAYEGTPLTVRKALYTKVNTPQGPRLEPVDGPVNVGDELVVRIEVRVDRDMEYVHLKDQRGSGTEPVDVLSQYQFRDGLAYYQSTRDTATHFFIDYLPKGTYVLEYSTWVVHRGQYTSGVASIECMYAPEFNSHSGSVTLTVK